MTGDFDHKIDAYAGLQISHYLQPPGERDLIDRAVTETGLTEFVVTNAVEAARRVLADRDRFELDAEVLAAWESIDDRLARDLLGLRRLMERPSPFVE